MIPVAQRESGADSGELVALLRRTDWLWLVIGGFYLLAYLFWYVPPLAGLPGSVRDPPERFPWHWPLDFASTGLSGAVLLYLGFHRAAALTATADDPAAEHADRRPAE